MTRRISVVALGVAVVGATLGVLAQSKPAPPAAAAPAGPVIVVETAKGDIEIELAPKDAPKSVEHILQLVRKDFYRGMRFHWVKPGVIQMGDPQSRNLMLQSDWGRKGSGTPVGVAEPSTHTFTRGAVGMAFIDDPKEADSQIFINKTANPSLDGKYTMIGRVTKGMEVADKIEIADVVKRVYVKGEAK
jgi:cyclophilin family peptidyl-prolyl cis-trans isomerase